MAKNIAQIPFTEIRERVNSLGRTARQTDSKVRGVIQDLYIHEIPSLHDWNFLLNESSITTTDKYNTGTCSINTQGSTVTFSSDVTITSGMVGRKIKISGNETVYRITAMEGSTGVTINPSFEGSRNASGDAYNIYQDEYALAHNFDRFPKDGGLYRWVGGRKEVKPEWAFQEYVRDSIASPSVPNNVRLVGINSSGHQLVELDPPPNDRRNYGYSYYQTLSPMSENTSGTISSILPSTTTVNGNTDCRFTEATTGDYFRVDNFGTGHDSTWYRILSIENDSSMTLQSAFANSQVTTLANYTISSAPNYPSRLHPALIYGALQQITTDQNDPTLQVYRNKYAQIMSDSKRIYVSRVYSQEVEGIYEDYNYRR